MASNVGDNPQVQNVANQQNIENVKPVKILDLLGRKVVLNTKEAGGVHKVFEKVINEQHPTMPASDSDELPPGGSPVFIKQ